MDKKTECDIAKGLQQGDRQAWIPTLNRDTLTCCSSFLSDSCGCLHFALRSALYALITSAQAIIADTGSSTA